MLFPLRDHNPTRRPPLVTYSLVGINVAVLLYMTTMSEPRRELFVIEHGFIPARIEHLGADQPLQVQIESLRAGPQGQVVRSREVVDLPTSASTVLATLFTSINVGEPVSARGWKLFPLFPMTAPAIRLTDSLSTSVAVACRFGAMATRNTRLTSHTTLRQAIRASSEQARVNISFSPFKSLSTSRTLPVRTP